MENEFIKLANVQRVIAIGFTALALIISLMTSTKIFMIMLFMAVIYLFSVFVETATLKALGVIVSDIKHIDSKIVPPTINE